MKYLWRVRRALKQSRFDRGFTILEQIIILAILVILLAIAAPNWLSFLRMRELNVAQDQVQIMIKQAQHLAKVQRIPYRFVIHENTGVVQWGIAPINRMSIDWTSANQVVGLDENQTTFRKDKDLNQWFLVLDDDGAIDGQLGRVTLCVKSAPQDERCSTLQKCVIMSTLLGETRRGEWHPKLRDDRFNCY
jgi:type II secretory pathway pseudopilin PulG